MARRSKAREVALQMLYLIDVNNDVDGRAVKELINERLKDNDLRELAWWLFSGTAEHRAQLDERVQQIAENWKLDRMPPTDRNILRVGAFEMVHMDTPASVVIDEAIELAKKFGTKQSSQFVNGILDKLVPEEKRRRIRRRPRDDQE
ncbi:MAG: transcription antitermination factor NusB [Planctomycetaceae bacterium]|nr:transcription antitermination factor NusB [Planctomycetaceae bacterium]